MSQGPNIKKLIIHKITMIAIPAGSDMGDALNFMAKPGAIGAAAKEATEWVGNAIKAIRLANDPNPWKDATDEEIAGEILSKIDAKKSVSRLINAAQAVEDAQYGSGSNSP